MAQALDRRASAQDGTFTEENGRLARDDLVGEVLRPRWLDDHPPGWGGYRFRRYVQPAFPPTSEGSAGPTKVNPDLVSTLWDAIFA